MSSRLACLAVQAGSPDRGVRAHDQGGLAALWLPEMICQLAGRASWTARVR